MKRPFLQPSRSAEVPRGERPYDANNAEERPPMNKTALIAGITGQDGAYLAHHLLLAGYRVIGSSRVGQTSVGLSFEQPVECLESIAGGTLNFLEVLRYLGAPTRVISAGSSECFGDTSGEPASAQTSFHPRSPYTVAKSIA